MENKIRIVQTKYDSGVSFSSISLSLKGNKKHGLCEWFYYDGLIDLRANYFNNRKHGLYEQFNYRNKSLFYIERSFYF